VRGGTRRGAERPAGAAIWIFVELELEPARLEVSSVTVYVPGWE
jgi:hypothetical protein